MSTMPQIGGFGISLPYEHGYRQMVKDERQNVYESSLYSAEAAQKQMDFQERMSNTSWQRGTADMQAAGINPMLAFAQGGASSPQGQGFAGKKANTPAMPGASGSVTITTAAQVDALNAQSEKARAEADKAKADEAEVRERTPSHAVDREYTAHKSAEIRQSIGESAMRIEKIIAETERETASAAQLRQQTKNLGEAIPQIRATVELLKTQTGEGQQKIKANLPEIERQLANLERLYREMEMPGRQTDEAYNSSAVGTVLRSIRNALKDINPLGGTGILINPRRK